MNFVLLARHSIMLKANATPLEKDVRQAALFATALKYFPTEVSLLQLTSKRRGDWYSSIHCSMAKTWAGVVDCTSSM